MGCHGQAQYLTPLSPAKIFMGTNILASRDLHFCAPFLQILPRLSCPAQVLFGTRQLHTRMQRCTEVSLSCAQCRRHQASMEPPEWVTLPYTLGSPPLVRHCTTQRPPSWAGPHKRI
mmetsp:Transcript_28587/g.77132  ORF Transcript_28587/g.77132 Transcript_28587/m.77132 type:complete len:117 (-) Transcript_28587:485-835(-)